MSKPTEQMQAVLNAYAELGPLSIEMLSPELARSVPLLDRGALSFYGHHFTKRALVPMPLPVGRVKHLLIPGPDGPLLVRVYTPKGNSPEGGWPILVYFHGGGWVIADLDTYDSSCRGLCQAAGCVVVSVRYRQAPEHPWPAATDDAFAAYQWVQENVFEFGGAPSKVAVGGESAGGNLAAVVAQMTRGHAVSMPVHQLLIYPVTDLANGTQSRSAREHANAKPLNTAMLHWFYEQYLPPGVDRTNASISPVYATDLGSLPPATVILAEIDPLRSDGEFYVTRLEEAGVPVELRIYDGVTHEFFGLAGLVHEATDAMAFAGKRLREAFAAQEALVGA